MTRTTYRVKNFSAASGTSAAPTNDGAAVSSRHRKRLRARAACAVIALLSVNTCAALAAPGDILNLGTLGGNSSYPHGINAAGQVVGESDTPTVVHAFRWTSGGTGGPASNPQMLDLGTFGGQMSFGRGINSAGQVTGYAEASGGGSGHAFLWTSGGTGGPASNPQMKDLGTLRGFSYSESGHGSFGYAINDSGQVAGHSNRAAGFNERHAFLWTPDDTGGAAANPQMKDLGTLGGSFAQSFGRAINNAGQVVGISDAVNNSEDHAFRWTSGGTVGPTSNPQMADLGTLGGTYSEAKAINASGQVAGWSETTGNSGVRAFRYSGTPGSGGAMVNLGTLGGASSTAWAINDAGFVIGSSERSAAAGGGSWPTVWQPDNTAIDLDAWLDASDPAIGALWTLQGVTDVTEDGLIFAYGIYSGGASGLSDGASALSAGESGYIILDGSTLLVPEPASLSLLAVSGLAMLRRKR